MMGATGRAWEAAGRASDLATGAASDDELIVAVATGDRRALELLYRRHAPWLAGRLAARTSSLDLAEEALQDTFVAVWRSARASPRPRRGTGLAVGDRPTAAGQPGPPAADWCPVPGGDRRTARPGRHSGGGRPRPGRLCPHPPGHQPTCRPSSEWRSPPLSTKASPSSGRPSRGRARRHPQEPPPPGAPASTQGAWPMTEHPTELLLQVADGAVPPPEARAHLTTCQRCRADPGGAGPGRPGLCLARGGRRAGRPTAKPVGTPPGRGRGAARAGPVHRHHPVAAAGLARGQPAGPAAGRRAAHVTADDQVGRQRCCCRPTTGSSRGRLCLRAGRSTRPSRRSRPPRCRRWPP